VICARMSMRGSVEALATAVRSSAMANSRRSATEDGIASSGAMSAVLECSADRGPRACFVFRGCGSVRGVALRPVTFACFARCFAVRHAELQSCCFPFRGFLFQTGHSFAIASQKRDKRVGVSAHRTEATICEALRCGQAQQSKQQTV
jgi:hypothetical protein